MVDLIDVVVYSREGVMEFLLVNHPLDCPICDQAGECDLQVGGVYTSPLTSPLTYTLRNEV